MISLAWCWPMLYGLAQTFPPSGIRVCSGTLRGSNRWPLGNLIPELVLCDQSSLPFLFAEVFYPALHFLCGRGSPSVGRLSVPLAGLFHLQPFGVSDQSRVVTQPHAPEVRAVSDFPRLLHRGGGPV